MAFYWSPEQKMLGMETVGNQCSQIPQFTSGERLDHRVPQPQMLGRSLDGRRRRGECTNETLTKAAPGLEGPGNLTATTWERSQASTLQSCPGDPLREELRPSLGSIDDVTCSASCD